MWKLHFALLTVSFLFAVSCSSSPPKTASANSQVKAGSDSTAVQANPPQSDEELTPPEIVRTEEVQILKDVKMLTVGNAQGHYFISCNKTQADCITPMPGKDYLLFSKTTRWKFPGATGVVTLDFLQQWSGTYNDQENIGLIPSEGDRTRIGMYWLRSWSKNNTALQ
jgi:hypothetical protein